MAQYKQWREENRTKLGEVVPLGTPYSLIIEASSLCNAKCSYCAHSENKQNMKFGNMSMELFRRVLHDASEFEDKFRLFELFGYGEPLCNPNIADMIYEAKASGLVDKVAFTTNGLLFNKEKIDNIIESGIDIIRISLQGIDGEGYKKTCGVDIDFDRFVDTLGYLYGHKEKASIRIKIADMAIKDVEGGEERFREIFGRVADSIFVERIIPIYSDVDYDSMGKEIYDNAYGGRENVGQKSVNVVCHRPFYRMRISSDGEVTASCCDTPHDFVYGNLSESSLKELWLGKIHKGLLMMQLKGERFNNPICRKCVLPNDITNEDDLLDPYAGQILERLVNI